MGDANPIRILGDYFKPSHEGYRNTIELPVGNNVLDQSLHGRILLLLSLLSSFQREGLQNFATISLCFNNIKENLSKNDTTQMAIDYAAGERLRKLRPKEAWATIEKLAQYEDEGWKDLVDPNEGSLDHKNPDIK
nr:hypothetical protein [Tanacetum cinerariifolium]